MTLRIVYTRPDGGLSIIVPAPGTTIERARLDVPADATDVHECDHTELPTDRTFRNAWRRGGAKAVDIPMPPARDVVTNAYERKNLAPPATQIAAAQTLPDLKALLP